MADRSQFILFSGAAQGTEAAFGNFAEKFGIEEVNFTFEGHNDFRNRGIRVLNHEELQSGNVSLSYVSKLLNRQYPDTALFRKILQTIWHVINNSNEIFVVGKILPDNTVNGGTGWGAEFAKICSKTLFVFDQEKDSWFEWNKLRWDEVSDPKISQPHFAGTGTRYLEENGKQAIMELFVRSFNEK